MEGKKELATYVHLHGISLENEAFFVSVQLIPSTATHQTANKPTS